MKPSPAEPKLLFGIRLSADDSDAQMNRPFVDRAQFFYLRVSVASVDNQAVRNLCAAQTNSAFVVRKYFHADPCFIRGSKPLRPLAPFRGHSPDANAHGSPGH